MKWKQRESSARRPLDSMKSSPAYQAGYRDGLAKAKQGRPGKSARRGQAGKGGRSYGSGGGGFGGAGVQRIGHRM